MKPTLFNLDLNTRSEDGQTIAELNIDGVIGFDWWASEEEQNTKEQMRAQLKQIQAIQADKIVVNISSLGGDVDHGLAIHDLLASNDAEVETHVIGMTASAATIIAQAGDTRSMSDNALYLVHRAWTMGMGNANDFEALAKDLNKLDDRISNIYAKRSGFDKDDFMSLMNEANGDGIWISAEEAQEYGSIDSIAEPMKAAAKLIDIEEFKNSGTPIPKQFIEGGGYFDGVLTQEQLFDLLENDDRVKEILDSHLSELNKDVIHDQSTENKTKEEQAPSASATSRERLKQQIAITKLKAQSL